MANGEAPELGPGILVWLVRREAPGAPLLRSGYRIGAGSVESKSSGERGIDSAPSVCGRFVCLLSRGAGCHDPPPLARTRIRQEPGYGAWSANHSGENESPHLQLERLGLGAKRFSTAPSRPIPGGTPWAWHRGEACSGLWHRHRRAYLPGGRRPPPLGEGSLGRAAGRQPCIRKGSGCRTRPLL